MIVEGIEFPLPKSSNAPTYLYVNKKGETGFVERIKKGGFGMSADDFDIEFKSERDIEVFFKKHNWHFSGVE